MRKLRENEFQALNIENLKENAWKHSVNAQFSIGFGNNPQIGISLEI